MDGILADLFAPKIIGRNLLSIECRCGLRGICDYHGIEPGVKVKSIENSALLRISHLGQNAREHLDGTCDSQGPIQKGASRWRSKVPSMFCKVPCPAVDELYVVRVASHCRIAVHAVDVVALESAHPARLQQLGFLGGCPVNGALLSRGHQRSLLLPRISHCRLSLCFSRLMPVAIRIGLWVAWISIQIQCLRIFKVGIWYRFRSRAPIAGHKPRQGVGVVARPEIIEARFRVPFFASELVMI